MSYIQKLQHASIRETKIQHTLQGGKARSVAMLPEVREKTLMNGARYCMMAETEIRQFSSLAHHLHHQVPVLEQPHAGSARRKANPNPNHPLLLLLLLLSPFFRLSSQYDLFFNVFFFWKKRPSCAKNNPLGHKCTSLRWKRSIQGFFFEFHFVAKLETFNSIL